jgi:hypothetical protein
LVLLLADESERPFIHVLMNSEFVFSTDGGMFDANHQSKANRSPPSQVR